MNARPADGNSQRADALVSVVIPAYRAEEFIGQTIESVHEQAYRPLEVVVVEDCSPDSTYERVEQWSGGLPEDPDFRLRLIRQPENKGGAAALARGFREADGDYLCWLSADDAFVGRTKLEEQVAQLRSGAVLSFGRSFYQGPTIAEAAQLTAHWHPRLPFLDRMLLRLPWARLVALLFVNPINGSTVMIRRDAWEQLGDFDAELRNIDQDSDMWMRYSALGARFAMLEEPCGFYRIHPGQTSNLVEDCIVGASATRIRLILALERTGILPRVLRSGRAVLALALRAGWHRDRPLVAQFLVERALTDARDPFVAWVLRRMDAQLRGEGLIDQALAARARELAEASYESHEFKAFVQRLRERYV